MVSLFKQNSYSLKSIIQKYRLFIFDCDGVIWIEKKIFGTTDVLISELNKQNKLYCFLTNNNSESPKTLLKHFHKNENLKTLVKENQIYNSGILTALHVKNNHSDIKKIFLIGSNELAEEFLNKGIEVIKGTTMDDFYGMDKIELDKICIPDKDIDGVVVGYDEKINYYKIVYSVRILKKPNTKFFGTNIDRYRISLIDVLPGSYVMISSIESASDRKAEIVTKPDPHCLQIILDDINLNLSKQNIKPILKEEILMIGDNMTTDIKFANNSGIDSLLVLTGVTSKETADKIILKQNKNRKNDSMEVDLDNNKFGIPTYILEDLRVDNK